MKATERSRRWPALLAALLLGGASGWSCGRTASDEPRTEAESGAGLGGSGSLGGSASYGGALGGSASYGGGGGPSGGAAPAGGSGGFPSGGAAVPGETEEERVILEPLFEDPTSDSLSAAELIEVSRRVGLARGYALCRCALSPESPPESVAGQSCAKDESGQLGRIAAQAAGRRCLAEALAAEPALALALRCEVEEQRNYGLAWLAVCWQGGAADPAGMPRHPEWPPAPCPRADELFQRCFFPD